MKKRQFSFREKNIKRAIKIWGCDKGKVIALDKELFALVKIDNSFFIGVDGVTFDEIPQEMVKRSELASKLSSINSVKKQENARKIGRLGGRPKKIKKE